MHKLTAPKIAGFTMIELLIVMAIMATLTGVMIPNLRGYNTNQKLVEAASQVQSDIRLIQTNATSGVKCTSSTAATWYLQVDPNKPAAYKIGNTCLTAAEASAETRTFSSGVTIKSIQYTTGVSTTTASLANCTRVSFSNIYSNLSFSNSNATCSISNAVDQVTITLSSSATGAITNQVVISKGGSVSVK